MRFSPRSFFRELHRRKVYSSAFAYVVMAWLLLQVADVVLPIYDVPEWVLRMFSTLLFLGFPVVVVVAWFFDFKLNGLAPIPDNERSTDNPAGAKSVGGLHAVELPDGPSIAVLPFRNLGEEREQDFFAEALGSDIVTGLTQSSHLFVLTAGANHRCGRQRRASGRRCSHTRQYNNHRPSR